MDVDVLLEQVIAMKAIEADYVTGYDHPNRYGSPVTPNTNLPHWDPNIYLVNGRHWRTHESTCLTFTARVSTIREDASLFRRYAYGLPQPNDRELFRHMKCLGAYSHFPRRRLIGPIPSLNTHAHLPWLAPSVDWRALAESVARSYAAPSTGAPSEGVV